MERWCRRELKYNGNEKQAGNCQRPSRMDGECTGNQGPQWTVALKEEEKKKSI
jgi:hypothetical protein